MTFLGWKLSTGEVVVRIVLDEANDVWVKLGEHEAYEYRRITGYKGKMTPQYAR